MSTMKASLYLAVLMAIGMPAAVAQESESTAQDQHQGQHETKTYGGGWFEVRYPADFTVEESMVSNMPDKFDSARFISPDGKVAFYVYSPQWNGEASDIAPGPDEHEVSREVKKSDKNTVTFWTIAARDGSRTRSYQETREHISDTNWVLGIEYADQAAYQHYRPQYLQFKQSLQQFADE